MIEKLKRYQCEEKLYTDLASKINEIIDYLPQEKVLCPKCDGGADKQPTKEVPDIREVLEKFMDSAIAISGNTDDYSTIEKDLEKLLDTTEKEISALCRKENV